MKPTATLLPLTCCLVLLLGGSLAAQVIVEPSPDTWITATASAAGTDNNAKDEAVRAALRKAVEEGCGVFLTAQSKTENYKTVYDKVFADAVGYVKEFTTVKTWIQDGQTYATVKALVSKQKFERDWASIAHTVNQEGNPRVLVAITEATLWTTTGPVYRVEEAGTVQGKIEDFLLSRRIELVDRATAVNVSKRDILLAALKDDTKEVAALGARFHADVVVIGQASAKFGKELEVPGGLLMYQYVATLTVRAIQTDSARVLASKTFGPETVNVLQKAGGEEKALAGLAEKAAPEVLAAVVDAWRRRAEVKRTVQLTISGMDYDAWKTFKDEVEKIDGIQALRLRDITEGIANIEAEYRFTTENLADRVTALKGMKLKVVEITANRLKLKRSEE